MIFMIYATNEKDALGKDNKLLYNNSEDLKFFKNVTYGNTVVMGRKTWESMGGKPLKGRLNIVLSRHFFMSDEELLEMIYQEQKQRLVFIIGGASIYKLFESEADGIFVTRYNDSIDGDTHYQMDGDIYRCLGSSENMPFGNVSYKREFWVNRIRYQNLDSLRKATQNFSGSEAVKSMEGLICLT